MWDLLLLHFGQQAVISSTGSSGVQALTGGQGTVSQLVPFYNIKIIKYRENCIETVAYLASTDLTFYNSKFGKVRIPYITFLVDYSIFSTSSYMKH